jgi:hypothetical protein
LDITVNIMAVDDNRSWAMVRRADVRGGMPFVVRMKELRLLTPDATDLGKAHRYKNDICLFCGGGVDVAFQPCPSR